MTRALVILACAMLAACGRPERTEGVDLTNEPPWAYSTPHGVDVAAVYLELTAWEATTLLSASTSVADRIEMHSSSEENGMMKMRRMEWVALEAGKPFRFEPGGAHLMLIGLHQPLVAGTPFDITLQFDRGYSMITNVRVVELGSR
jgi:periplasmic copper chaperone A